MNRKKQLARKTRIKPISDKRRKLMAKVKPFRDRYLAAHLVCEVCLKRAPQDVHEICSGAHREKSLDKDYAVLAVCRPCHDEIQGWAKSKQLAMKLLRSPEMFGLNFDRINELRGWGKNEFEPMDAFKHLELKTA